MSANIDTRSVVGALASEKILELACSQDPQLFEETMKKKEAQAQHLGDILVSMVTP